MTAIGSRFHFARWLLLVCLAAAAAPSPAHQLHDEDTGFFVDRWWFSAGLGGGSVNLQAPAPAAQRNAFGASIDFGYRLSPDFGVGFDAALVAPGGGCAPWECTPSVTKFAPVYRHMRIFGEYRPRQSGWRLRAGVGVSRFCYRRHWSDSALNWADMAGAILQAVLDDDYTSNETVTGSGAYRCDAKHGAFSGAVSAGYDFPSRGPVSMGIRLTAEAADFRATPSIGLPAFQHRAVMVSLHVNLN